MRTSIALPFLVWSFFAIPACSDDSSAVPDRGVQSDAGADAGTPIKDDELVSACLATTACGINTYPILANCVDAYHTLHRSQGLGAIYDSIYRCVNAAKGACDKIRTCFDAGGTCDKTFKGTCEGSKAVSCDLIEGRIYKLDCSLAALKCGTKKETTPTAYCTMDPCITSLGDNCNGTRLLSCNSGILEVQDCAIEGMICASGSGPGSSGAACTGSSSTSCNSKFFVPSCTGTVANKCVNGKEHALDCAKLSLRTTSCSGGTCVAKGTACDHTYNRCAGEQIEVCLDGSWLKYDCKTLGLGACKTKTSATGQWAACGDPANP